MWVLFGTHGSGIKHTRMECGAVWLFLVAKEGAGIGIVVEGRHDAVDVGVISKKVDF